MIEPADIIQVLKGLNRDVKLMGELNELLQEQYKLMSRRESSMLEPLNHKAVNVMATLKKSHSNRERILSSLPGDNSDERLKAFIKLLPEGYSKTTERLFRDLSQYSKLCLKQNEKNGKLLAYQRSLIQKLLGSHSSEAYPEGL